MKASVGALLGAAVLLLAATACNTDSLPPAAGFAAVTGTVVDGVTKKPIAGALVTIDTVLTATSDATGKFLFEKVPSGIADYTVQASGYTLLTSTATIEPGKPFELDLTLAEQTQH